MNRKFSTLLAMGLLMAGSAFNSAWADQIQQLVASTAATKVESDQYVIVQDFSGSKYVFGFEKQDDGTLKQIVVPFDTNIAAADLAKYAWTITETTSAFAADKYSYSFKNVSTGSLLRVTKGTTDGLTTSTIDPKAAVVTDPSVTDANTYYQFVFPGFAKYNGGNGAFAVFPNTVAGPFNYVQMRDDVDSLEFKREQSALFPITFYKIAQTEISDNALNSLYNLGGFSFALKNGTGVANIFDQRLMAIDVKSTVIANEQTDASKWGFPAGTYFVTEHPSGTFDNTASNEEKYAYLKACTFIVLSSTESEEVTADDRAKGQGFKLVEMTGAQLYKYIGTATANKVSGDEVSVYNACFQVTGLSTNEYPYAINNNSFRYLAKADASSAADKVHKTAAVSLKVLKIGGVDHLTTVASTDKNFVFKFGESGVVKGISLLKSDAPAVYNIRFVSGSSDRTELNKYLTVGLADSDTNWDLVAKGEALANNVLATPAYQFVITKVNGNDVTFTNRETGKSFTTKLFDEGDGVYSLTAADGVFVANINRSSYGVSVSSAATPLNNTLIELTESEVDPYAGFWNVADGTMVTLGFSRDVNNTSNILYAYADGTPLSLVTNGDANLADDLYDAAQWELNAIPSYNNGVITIKRDYVYNNNDKVAVEPYGDVVSLQKYYIQYVKDAEETYQFMTYANNAAPTFTGGTEYVIRQNADGSVSIMNAADVTKNNAVTVGGVNSTIKHIQIAPSGDKYIYNTPYAYNVAKASTGVNTYLLTEAPYKSWDKDGYVSIKTEVGNYLSMNENRDGIVLDNDATPYYLHITNEDAVAPSFFISKSLGSMEGERLFMFNSVDSIGYQMVGNFDPKYQWSEGNNKIIFKTAILNETADTLALTVKGEVAKYVAAKANNKENVWAGLDRFQWQVIEAEDGHYLIRQNGNGVIAGKYLVTINEKLTWGDRKHATHFALAESDGPTANEAIAAEGVQVIGGQGVVTVQGAAGKVITVANILGQTIANQVAASDNVTIAAPAGVVVVAVDGEATKVVVK